MRAAHLCPSGNLRYFSQSDVQSIVMDAVDDKDLEDSAAGVVPKNQGSVML